MNTIRSFCLLALFTLFGAGCGHKEGDDDHDHSGHDGHDHGEETQTGATFKPGKGVMLSDETRKSLGVEVTDVSERRLPHQIRFTAQIFGEKHHHLPDAADHSGCDVHGSGFVATDAAARAKAGQPVELLKDTNQSLTGVVLGAQKAVSLGETEIIFGVSNATTALKPGEFVPARISLPRETSVTAMPHSALLHTSEGAFVYAVNGDAFLRTAVKTGVETEGWVEVTDGLLAGDTVVTKPVQALWLIELRATKGGGHSH